MKGFIEVRNEFSNRILININHIEEVREHPIDNNCTIYLAFNVPDASQQDYHTVRKTYDEIVAMIREAME